MMVGRGSGVRPISTSNTTINTVYIIEKARVTVILKTASTFSIMTPIINSYIFMKPIINKMKSNRYTQQYTMVTWVMGVRVGGMGPV